MITESSGNNEIKSNQLKSRAIEIDSSDEELEDPLHNSNININAINWNNDIELPIKNNVDDIKEKQSEVNDLAKSISQLSIDENSDLGIIISSGWCSESFVLVQKNWLCYH